MKNAGSAFAEAFEYPAFTIIWAATFVSNVGGWMYSAAAGWLMTDLTRNALLVSMVQVANNLPLLIFTVLAGAISDNARKRRFLIVVEVATVIVSGIFAAMVWLHKVSPSLLLMFLFLIGALTALGYPAWQSVVTELVPRKALAAAISANSVGVNSSRAIGPALAGTLIVPAGIASPFIANVISNFGVIAALLWWREPKKSQSDLPAERIGSGIRTGMRYAFNNRMLRATLGRAVAFFLFGSSYWALLPLVARQQIEAGPQLYGVLLGAIGASAVAGAFGIGPWKTRLGADRLVAAGSLGTAVAIVLFAVARTTAVGLLAAAIAGVCWIVVVSTLNVSAQAALPDWVRGRGMAVYISVFFGALTVGSALWGEVGAIAGLPLALMTAAVGTVAAIPLTRRWKLQSSQTLDLTPSMHWPAPTVAESVNQNQSPVLVVIQYQLADPQNRSPFLTAMQTLRRERLRDGAYLWGIFEDVAQPAAFVETFLLESWVDHLRQHERVTRSDAALEQSIRDLLMTEPNITHFITPVS
jgi:MFS family permease